MFLSCRMVRGAVVMPAKRHDRRRVMLYGKLYFANDFVDHIGRFAAQHFVRTRFGNQVDVVHVGVQLHPVGYGLLNAPVDTSNRSSKFVRRHMVERPLYLSRTNNQLRVKVFLNQGSGLIFSISRSMSGVS